MNTTINNNTNPDSITASDSDTADNQSNSKIPSITLTPAAVSASASGSASTAVTIDNDGTEYSRNHHSSTSNSTTSNSNSNNNPTTTMYTGSYTCFRTLLNNCIYHFKALAASRTKKILLLSCIFSLMFIIATIVYLYITLNAVKSHYEEVLHTDTVKVQLIELYQGTIEGESAVRGYGLTANSSLFLINFHSNYQSIVYGNYNNLLLLTLDNDSQMNKLIQLKPILDQRYDQLNDTINIRSNGGTPADTAEYIMRTQSVQTQSLIRNLIQSMIAEENRLLYIRKHRASTSSDQMIIVMFCSLISCGLSIFCGLLIGYDWDTKQLKLTNIQLSQLLTQAQEATALKTIFLANMSHELRTPLNGVCGMTQLLTSTELNEEQVDIVDTILHSADSMLRLINDLLLFSKIESGKFELLSELFPIQSFIKPINDMFQLRASNKHILYNTNIDNNIPLLLFTDQGRLRQVLVNLIDNAIKFTHNGEVQLNIKLIKKSNRNKHQHQQQQQSQQQPKSSPTTTTSKRLKFLHKSTGNNNNNNNNNSKNTNSSSTNNNTNANNSNTPSTTNNLQPITNSAAAAAYITSSRTPLPGRRLLEQPPNNNTDSNIETDTTNNITTAVTIEPIELIIDSIDPIKSSPNNNTTTPASVQMNLLSLAQSQSNNNLSTVTAATATTTATVIRPQLPAIKRLIATNHLQSNSTPPSQNSNINSTVLSHTPPNSNSNSINTISDNESCYILFQVIDSGIGIPAAVQSKIFEPFSQADMSTTRQYGGTGLGLSISKQLVNSMGGSLKVKSQPGYGSTFSFMIPAPPSTFQSINTAQSIDNNNNNSNPIQSNRHNRPPTVLSNSVLHNGSTPSSSGSRVSIIGNNIGNGSQPGSIENQYRTLNSTVIQRLLTNNTVATVVNPTNPAITSRSNSSSSRRINWHPEDLIVDSDYLTTADMAERLVHRQKLSATAPITAITAITTTSATIIPISTSIEEESIVTTVGDQTTTTTVTIKSDNSISESSSTAIATATSIAAKSRSSTIMKDLQSNNSIKLRVLVVEDNLINQKVCKRLLERAGHTVILADNGEIAVNLFNAAPFDYDLLIMDWHMPHMDGLTATSIIRQSEQLFDNDPSIHLRRTIYSNTHIPIIACTASAMDSDREKCFKAGVDDIIIKPIDSTELYSKLQSLTIQSNPNKKLVHFNSINTQNI